MYLLDANILIALSDADHTHHGRAMRFFGDHAVTAGWATCPLTENVHLGSRLTELSNRADCADRYSQI